MNSVLHNLPSSESGYQGLLKELTALRRYFAGKQETTGWVAGGHCLEFEKLANVFGLNEYERRLLLLAVALELDTDIKQLENDFTFGTVGWALSLDANSYWDAWHPSSPLWRWHLLRTKNGNSPRPDSYFRIDLSVLYRLMGLPAVEVELESMRYFSTPELGLSESQQTLVAQIHQVLLQATDGAACIALGGVVQNTACQIAQMALQKTQLKASFISVDAIPARDADNRLCLRLLEREMLLDHRVPVFVTNDVLPQSFSRLLDDFSGPLFVIGELAESKITRDVISFRVPQPNTLERRYLWEKGLEHCLNNKLERSTQAQDELAQLAYHFPLENYAIARIAAASTGDTDTQRIESCWREARLRSRPSRQLLECVDCRGEWDDLVLPATQIAILHDIVAQVRQRARVYEDWKFASKSTRGLAITALFSGASGVGKTFSAEVLAKELQLDLFRVDLAQVADKYVGETEKHIDAIFNQAAESAAILFFDEADALFSQRGEVKGGQDRYANMTVGYLLQRMETYPGLAILCTNLVSQLDDAFMRRIRFAVHFPFPCQAERQALWKKAFPLAAPVENIDWKLLSRLSFNGGDIRTIALNSAFLAANAGTSINMNHISHAVEIEAGKSGRQGADTDLRRLLSRNLKGVQGP